MSNHLKERAGAPVLTSSERKRAESLSFELEVAANTCHGRAEQLTRRRVCSLLSGYQGG